MHKSVNQMIEDQYTYLTMADSDMDFILLKNYLSANGIPVITREKGFGGPIRAFSEGNFTPAHIEVFVKDSDCEEAAKLLDYEEFSAELDAELGLDTDDWDDNDDNKEQTELVMDFERKTMFEKIQGHQAITNHLAKEIKSSEVFSSAYLFSGIDGIGKNCPGIC